MKAAGFSARIRVAHLIYSPAIGGSETFAIEVCSGLNTSVYDPIILFLAYMRESEKAASLTIVKADIKQKAKL